MEIELAGEFTELDVKHALSLGYPRWFPVFRIGFILFLALPAFFASFTSIRAAVSEGMLLEPMVLLASFLPAIAALLIGVVFVYLLWLLPKRQARRIRNSPLCQGTFRGVATEETFALSNDASESTVRWDAYVQYRMSDDMVLLYQNNAAFNMVPRSLFSSDQDWQRFRQHVQATIPEEQPRMQPTARWILYAGIAVIIIVAVILGLANAP